MKYVNLITLSLTILISSFSFSQNFDLQWSEKKEYTNGKDGFFKYFLGSNEKYVYSIYNNLTTSRKKATKNRVDIVAMDKSSMKDVHKVQLRGKEDPNRKVALEGKEYLSTIVLEDVIYVFWIKAEKNITEIYAEVYSSELQELIPLQEVYSVTYPEVKKRIYASSPIVILSGKEWNNDVLIGTEIPNGQGKSIDFQYKVYDSKLEELTEAKIELPIVQLGKKTAGLSSSYRYGSDGNLYIQSNIALTKEEREDLADGEQFAFSKLTVVNIETAELVDTDIRFNGKNVFNFGYHIADDGVRLFGFYNDLDIDPKGNSTNGIFYATIDPNTNEMNEPIFSRFDEETLNELFKADPEDKKKTQVRSKKKREAAAEVDKVSLDDRFVIEDVKVRTDGSLVLFCSKMYNYTVTVCTTNSNGSQSCRQVPYCQKSNVTAFNINPEGDLNWATNLDRSITYGGHFIYDLRVVSRDDQAYVIYGSSYKIDADKKTRKTRKKKSEGVDKFEYAVFNMETGDVEKKEYVVNTPETEKKDRRVVSPLAITIIDEEYYINSQRIRFKPGLTTAACVASVVCWPLAYFVMLSPVFRKGEGYVGKIEVID